LTAQAGYQYLIHAYYFDKNGNSISPDQNHVPTSNATTFDTVSFGVLNQTTFAPTFQQKTADLFTPQVTLARQNFDLADPKAPLCFGEAGSSQSPMPVKSTPISRNFCYFMDLSLTAGQTFSDVATLQNTNVAISATVGTRFNHTGWSLAGQTVVTSRSYENVPGGRQDFLLQVGPLLSYAPAPTTTSLGSVSVTFSLPVSYYQNYSTVSKDAWSGIIVQPTLTVAFSPPQAVK
jgi:hypothetical protein